MQEEDVMENAKFTYDLFVQNTVDSTSHTLQWLPRREQDPDYADFEFAYFLMGTHNEIEDREDTLDIYRLRLPKITSTSKTVVDYSKLDAATHSKLTKVESLVHEGEVMKCRQNPHDQSVVASNTTSGVVNLYRMGVDNNSEPLIGKLSGLDEETFSMHWSPLNSGYLGSSSGTTACIWDANSKDGKALITLNNGHDEKPVNDIHFSPL